ncbi:MAG TPA: hypothetical protein VGP69_17590 [Gaiellaceae bacterium]|nr:hypothetical protein [Gaiellaceae bacterium]
MSWNVERFGVISAGVSIGRSSQVRLRISSRKCPAAREQLVDVRYLAVLVRPRRAHDAAFVDEECAASRDVLEPAELLSDSEGRDGIAVEVGEQPEIQVERLRPRDVRPRGVARDPDRLDAERLELRSPVTQELEFVRSGG